MEFRQWINESMTDVVHHGTLKNFNQFDMAYTTGQLGIHFGTWDQAMNVITDNYDQPIPGSKIISARLTLKKPLKLQDLGAWYGTDVVRMVNKTIGTTLNPSASDRSIRAEILKKGYDSVVYENEFEGDGISYIIFDPRQINITNVLSF